MSQPADPSANPPILWSFRRCPYAIRARLAIRAAQVTVELREIRLRDKPPAFLETSPSGTVPALRLADRVIDESLDIMVWALSQNDPARLLAMPPDAWQLIAENDGPFKTALDHCKYAVRFPALDKVAERRKAAAFLLTLDARLHRRRFLFGPDPRLADLAILPFVRQFAAIDRSWFDAQPWSALQVWLDRFLHSDALAQAMPKLDPWTPGAAPVWFGGPPA